MSALSPRVVTDTDHQRLFDLVERSAPALTTTPHMASLMSVLDEADLVPSDAVPPQVVTMRSKVILMGQDTHETLRLTLCYPHDHEADGVSVLTPLGAALLGARVGDRISWTGLDGQTREATITGLHYQPEASGEPHL